MMDLLQAKVIAEEYLVSIKGQIPVEVNFNYEITEEFPFGYIFYYNSQEYWDTRNFEVSLAGNGPVLVKCGSGELIILPSHQGVKRSLRELRLIE